MTPHPPHLPPKSHEATLHQRLRFLAHTLVTVAVAFLSGITATLVVIAWLLPTIIPQDALWIVNQDSARIPGAGEPSPSYRQQARLRTLALYDAQKAVEKNIYPQTARVGTAVLLSADGWSVMEGTLSVPASRLDAVDSQGRQYRVTQSVEDAASGVTFLKVQGDGFRIATFPNWNAIEKGTVFWSYSGEQWQEVIIDALMRTETGKGIIPAHASVYDWRLRPDVPPGSVLFSEDGSFAGFVADDTVWQPGWRVENQVSTLLESGRVRITAAPWKGFFVQDQVIEGFAAPVSGFYVTDVGASKNADSVRAGDILIAVQNTSILPEHFSRAVLTAPDPFAATILRDGAEMTVSVEKTPV